MQNRADNKYKRYQRGFSLIELLATLFLIGIAVAMVAVSVGSGNRPQQVNAAARYLHNAVHLAMEEAILSGYQIGLRFDIDEQTPEQRRYYYEWLYYDHDNREWLPISMELLDKQLLPEDVVVELRVDGQTVTVGTAEREDTLFGRSERQQEQQARQGKQPDIYFLSSGETQDFLVTLEDTRYQGSIYTLKGNILGQLTFKRPHEQTD